MEEATEFGFLCGLNADDFDDVDDENAETSHNQEIDRQKVQERVDAARELRKQSLKQKPATQKQKPEMVVGTGTVDSKECSSDGDSLRNVIFQSVGFESEEGEFRYSARDVDMYFEMERIDDGTEAISIGIGLSQALCLQGRRADAIAALQRARKKVPGDCSLTLALAKLFFREDDKRAAYTLCSEIIEEHQSKQGLHDGNNRPQNNDKKAGRDRGEDIDSDSMIADAFYIAGWIQIHGNDHTAAYNTWRKGADAVPTDNRLTRQQRKRECWDTTTPTFANKLSMVFLNSPHKKRKKIQQKTKEIK
jgi:tetratricopeptide (TPR) repeat protein